MDSTGVVRCVRAAIADGAISRQLAARMESLGDWSVGEFGDVSIPELLSTYRRRVKRLVQNTQLHADVTRLIQVLEDYESETIRMATLHFDEASMNILIDPEHDSVIYASAAWIIEAAD